MMNADCDLFLMSEEERLRKPINKQPKESSRSQFDKVNTRSLFHLKHI